MSENEAIFRKYRFNPISGIKEWLSFFWMVLINPRPQTFREIADYAPGRLRPAVLWIVAFCGSLYFFSVLTSGVVLSSILFLSFIILIPIVMLFWIYCMHIVYRLVFQGQFDLYDGLFGAAVCILIPLNLVRAVLLLIPFAGPVLSGLIFAYQVLLSVIAVYAITRLKGLQAIAVVVLSCLITAGALYLLSLLMIRLASTATMMF